MKTRRFSLRFISALAAAVSFAASLAFGQGVIVPPQTALKTVNGVTSPIAGATITVCAQNAGGIPCSPALANSVFKDAALTQPLSNPFFADTNGNYNFAIAPGNYTVTVTASGFSGYSYQVSAGNGTVGAGATLQTNGVNNTLQSIQNLVNGTGIGMTNPSGGQVVVTNTGVLSFNGRAGTVVQTLSDITGVFTGTCNSTTFLRGDGSCQAVTGTPAFSAITSGANIQANMQASTGATVAPLNIGQVAGSQAWLAAGLSAPTSTGANSGGTIIAAHPWLIQYTFQTAAGEMLPSVLLSGSTTTLTGGTCVSSACTLTINAPTFPTGVIGWNVYACDTSPTPCTAPQLRAACQNLGAGVNCTFTAPQTTNTSGVPTVNTAWTQPANVQATNAPAGAIPSVFFPKADGNNYPWVSVDWNSCSNSTGPPLPCGTPVFTHRTFFNDTQSATQAGKNAFVSFNHTFGVGTSTANQDRALWVTGATPTNDASTRYGIEGIQAELDFNCNGCTINGAPDGEVSTASFQLSDLAATNYTIPGSSGVIRASYFKNAAGVRTGADTHVIDATYSFNVAGAAAGTQVDVLNSTCANGVGGVINNVACVGYRFVPVSGSANRFNNGQIALEVLSGITPSTNDWLIRNDVLNYNILHGGGLYLGGSPAIQSAASTLNVNGSFSLAGALTTAPLATVTASAASCSGGVTTNTWTYVVVAKDSNGATTAKSANQNSTCAATLDGTHFVTLQANVSTGATSYDIYRTVSGGTPATLGKIGSATPSFSAGSGSPTINFVDNGLAGDGTTAPSVNTTGGIGSAGDMGFNNNKGQHFNTQAANNDYAGTVTLAAGAGTVTFTRAYTAAPVCVGTDQTNANAVKISTTTTAATFAGNATDVIAYICVGNPN